MNRTDKTALVTGANSGLGFEAAAQLAHAGWAKVILACRSVDKAEAARTQLEQRTGKNPFDVLAVDTSEVSSANAAMDQLRDRGERIDFMLLNAGASKQERTFTSDKVEITYASTLVGHHVMAVRALADGLLNSQARIVIAGSEGARGNLPGMAVHDVGRIAKESFNGDVVAAIEALCRLEVPAQAKFNNMREYVTAKVFVAWWAGALARKLPDGMTVNAVSPGSNVSTSFGRDASVAMRFLMVPMMKIMGSLIGMNGPVENGAKRYLDAAEYGDDQTGHFYATAHKKKLVGPMSIQTWPEYFTDQRSQEACFNAMVNLTGVGIQESARLRAVG